MLWLRYDPQNKFMIWKCPEMNSNLGIIETVLSLLPCADSLHTAHYCIGSHECTYANKQMTEVLAKLLRLFEVHFT